MENKKRNSNILMLSLFATGVAGIVAEYILATLATYFLGNSVFQWTIVLSLMLFAMGFGSRVSRYVETKVLETFILLEVLLSIIVGCSSIFVYSIMGYTSYLNLIIYGMAICVGFLIGMEIPLVTRFNSKYEGLKANISSVLEKDYYGSLIGGLFFAFIGLPYLGLTYTPFLLGGINLLVASIVFFKFRKTLVIRSKNWLTVSIFATAALLILGVYFAKPIIQFGEQSRYSNKVVYSEQTKFQKITLTQSKNNHVLYLNNSMQLNSMDEWLYHEPLVHPAMLLNGNPKNVLILGGGDGCGIREVLKYSSVETIKLVDLDPAMTAFGANHPVFRTMNQNAYHNEKVTVINQDAFIYLENDSNYYDVIIIDFPDPRSIELARLYSKEMYHFCKNRLRQNGILITQATSPFFQTKAYYSILKSMQSSGLYCIPIHSHVQSFGEWGWIIGSKLLNPQQMKQKLNTADSLPFNTRWLTADALKRLHIFGKPVDDTTNIEINSVHNPVLFKYYINGSSFNDTYYD